MAFKGLCKNCNVGWVWKKNKRLKDMKCVVCNDSLKRITERHLDNNIGLLQYPAFLDVSYSIKKMSQKGG